MMAAAVIVSRVTNSAVGRKERESGREGGSTLVGDTAQLHTQELERERHDMEDERASGAPLSGGFLT